MTEFTLDPNIVGEILKNNSQVRDELGSIIKKGLQAAQEMAPVGDISESAYDDGSRHPGDYRDGLQGRVVVQRSRMIGQVVSTDFKSWWIEFGTVNMSKQRVLGRTMDSLTTDGDTRSVLMAGD
jgi:hypothetical protein